MLAVRGREARLVVDALVEGRWREPVAARGEHVRHVAPRDETRDLLRDPDARGARGAAARGVVAVAGGGGRREGLHVDDDVLIVICPRIAGVRAARRLVAAARGAS